MNINAWLGCGRLTKDAEFNVTQKLREEFDRKMKKKIFCKGHFVFNKHGKINLVRIE